MNFKVKDKQRYLGENITEGDIIKIGRIKFKLRKFHTGIHQPSQEREEKMVKQETHKEIEKERLARKSVVNGKIEKKEEIVKENEEIPPCRF